MRSVGILSTAAALGAALLISSAHPANGAKPLDGRDIFRFDTFDDEQLWTSTLRLQEAVATVTPATALAVGLKVDADALPPPVVQALKSGQLDVNDPRVTLRLLELNAVVGVIGRVAGDHLKSMGITCAFCHSTVDNSLAPGIGHRLDGWPNRDLNVGAIVSLSPVLDASLKAVFQAWGPGKYDARHHAFDGTKLIVLNTPSLPAVIPPAFGLAGVGFETYTGDGPISYWNDYVGVTQMGGHGNFVDPRIALSITQKPDLVTPILQALRNYQLGLRTPPPPPGTFDVAAAARGQDVFNGAGRCSTCHIPPTYTDVLSGADTTVPLLHSPAEVGQDPEYAARSATGLYRTTPLRALWQHPPYFHDGSAADLPAVVDHYNSLMSLGLTDAQKTDLAEFLKSL